MGHEQLGKCGLFVKDANHGSFVDAHDRRFFQGSRGNGAHQLPGETGLAEKFSLFLES